jgi:hypothetical protein
LPALVAHALVVCCADMPVMCWLVLNYNTGCAFCWLFTQHASYELLDEVCACAYYVDSAVDEVSLTQHWAA